MPTDLFRPQVIEAKGGQRWGKPISQLPVGWRHVTYLLAAIVAAFIAFVSLTDFSRKESVRGRLRADGAEARVFVPQSGTLISLNVELGSIVKAGDVVAEFATQRPIDASSEATSAAIGATIKERDWLLQQIAAIDPRTRIAAERIDVELLANADEQTTASKTIALVKQRIGIATERVDSSSRLYAQGAASKEEARVREDALLVQRQQLVDLERRLSAAIAQERSLRVQKDSIMADAEREHAQMEQRLAQLDGQWAQARAQAGFVVKAPIAGKIAMLQLAQGDRAEPTRPIMTIISSDNKLVAEILAPSRAIGFVEPGQSVRLQFDAFPYQKFGSASGHVALVSASTIAPFELRAPVETREPVYTVTVALDRQSVAAFGHDVPLQSGMELSADIILEKRKLIEWLLEPLYAAVARSQTPS